MNGTQRKKRRIKLIKPRLQLRLVGVFVGLSTLSFLLQALLLGFCLSELATALPADGNYLMAAVPPMLTEVLLFSFGILLPLTVAVGVLVTFRIAGPVYRFEQHLSAIARGEDVPPCRIRQGDELWDLCHLINDATDALRRRHETPAVSALDDVPLRRVV